MRWYNLNTRRWITRKHVSERSVDVVENIHYMASEDVGMATQGPNAMLDQIRQQSLNAMQMMGQEYRVLEARQVAPVPLQEAPVVEFDINIPGTRNERQGITRGRTQEERIAYTLTEIPPRQHGTYFVPSQSVPNDPWSTYQFPSRAEYGGDEQFYYTPPTDNMYAGGSGYVPSPTQSPTTFLRDLITPETPLVTHRGEGSSRQFDQGVDLTLHLSAAADETHLSYDEGGQELSPKRNPVREGRGRRRPCILSPEGEPPHHRHSETSLPELLRNTKDLEDELKRSIREKGDLFKSGDFLIDKVKWGTLGYKERYYNVKFSVEGPTDIESKRKEIVLKYTEGLLWVLQYYFSGVASWTWFYPFHYGPFASDLRGMSQVKVKFEKGVPFLPLDQLLSVLPPGSASALPKAYAQLMLDENSRLIDLYPQDFEVDTEGKRFMWQAICKIPWIDERRLVAETRELKNELSENEAIRNSVKFDSLFIKSANKLADKICFLSQEPKSCKLDTRVSDGVGGIISVCHEEGIKKPCLGMEICDNKELHVLCVNYELPAGSNHIPRLLAGVELPQKTIFEDEIMETELWHEQQKHSRFESVHGQDKWRSENNKSITSKFSPNATTPNTKNFSPSVPHSHKGIGWGSGRGKPHLPPFHMDASGSCHVTNIRDTRSQHFVDNFRQLRVSETNHLARPTGRSQFRPHNNNYRYQSKNVGRFSSSVPHIEVIHKGAGVRWGSGRGRPSNSSNMDRVDTMATQKMPYLPPFHKDAVGSCDVTNIGDTRPQHFVDNVRQL
ncbi:hypothetical protein RJT34_31035 [Clitoria ternatea]|uniref:Xrn1 helical domain-containing protein n=1 Tax=Clitoria ternatea TaxID=43366 RepID=A0AAN9EXZ7_CLITE